MRIRDALPKPLRVLLRRSYMEASVALIGSFPYFGQRVFSPRHSVVFQRIAKTGVFEPDVLEVLTALTEPESTVLDVGANIGVITIALLASRRDINVVSIECSPSTLPFLIKTHSDSPLKSRWIVIEAAATNLDGTIGFFTSGPDNGAYDGLADTGRGGKVRQVSVNARTIDSIWSSLGKPFVSALKVDIEGGEAGALEGATELLATCRPNIVFEWNQNNLRAFGRKPEDIFSLPLPNYQILTLPGLTPALPQLIELQMKRNEMFLASPQLES